MKSTVKRCELPACTTPNDDQISKTDLRKLTTKPPLSVKPACEYRKAPLELSLDIRKAREQSTPCASSSSDYSSSTKDESAAENDALKQKPGTGCDESDQNVQLKKVRQIFEASTSSETFAPSTSRIPPGKSVTIQCLQELLHKQMGSGGGGKPEDYKSRKHHRSKSRTGKGLTSFASAAVRKRSRSRYSGAIKRSARVMSPSKKERPYRQWLGVSNCVTRDSKFIISSTQFRRDFTGKKCRGETSTAVSSSPAVTDQEVTSDTGRKTPNMSAAENDRSTSSRAKTRVGKDNVTVVVDVDESMSKSTPQIADKDKVPVHVLPEPANRSLVKTLVDKGKLQPPAALKEMRRSHSLRYEYTKLDRKIVNTESSMIQGPVLEDDSLTISDTPVVKSSKAHHRKKDRISRVHNRLHCNKNLSPCHLGIESDCSERQEFIFPEKSGLVDTVVAGTNGKCTCSNTVGRSTPLRGLTPQKSSVHELILIGVNEPPLTRQITRSGSIGVRGQSESPSQTEVAALRVECRPTPEQTELPGEVGVPDKAGLKENISFPENTDLIEYSDLPRNTGLAEHISLPEKSDLNKQTNLTEKADLPDKACLKENIRFPENIHLTDHIDSPENVGLTDHIILPDKSDFNDHICLPERVDLAEQIDRADKAGITEQTSLPEKAGFNEQISLPDKSDLSEQIDLPVKACLNEHISLLVTSAENKPASCKEQMFCDETKANQQDELVGKNSPQLRNKTPKPVDDPADEENNDTLSWVEEWLGEGADDMDVPESHSNYDVHKEAKYSTTDLSQTSAMKDSSAIETVNSSVSLGLSTNLGNRIGLVEDESIALSSPGPDESFSGYDLSIKDETKNPGDKTGVETGIETGIHAGIEAVQTESGEKLENSDRCQEDGQAASSNRYSSSETSHVDGFTSPDFKRLAHSISPRVPRQPHSKGPLLRTAVRARYRSYNTLPAYRRPPSHVYIRPGKNAETHTENHPGLPNYLKDKTPPPIPNKSLYMPRKSKMKNDAQNINSLAKNTKPPRINRCSVSPTRIVHTSKAVSLQSESLQGLSESSDESPTMEVSQLSKHADVGQSSTQTETGLGRPSKLSKLLQKMNRSKKQQHSGRYKRVQAIVDFTGTLPGQLSFEKGQIIQQRLADSVSGMSYGYYRIGRLKKKRKGLFPSHCVIDHPHTSSNH